MSVLVDHSVASSVLRVNQTARTQGTECVAGGALTLRCLGQSYVYRHRGARSSPRWVRDFFFESRESSSSLLDRRGH